jgi:hypothetical protein
MGYCLEFRIARDQHSGMVNSTGQSKTISIGKSVLRLKFGCLEHKGIGNRKYLESNLIDSTQHFDLLFIPETPLGKVDDFTKIDQANKKIVRFCLLLRLPAPLGRMPAERGCQTGKKTSIISLSFPLCQQLFRQGRLGR